MNIYLAKPRGFCAGVNRAITIVKEAVQLHGPPVYVLHEIVHNTHVIEELKEIGSVFVEELEEIPRGSVAIFSAHGVSLEVKKHAALLGLRMIDATCPLVAKVHNRVSGLNKMGYDIIVIGHKGHPEVEGTCGYAEGSVHVVSTAREVGLLQVEDENKVGYVTQTTLSLNDTREVLEAIKKRFPLLNSPDRTDICYATTNRQTAVHNLSRKAELLLVVGSKNSSNSNRLKEAAENNGVRAFLIDSYNEIDAAWLENVTNIGITAGASAPEHLVEEVVLFLSAFSGGKALVKEMEGVEEAVNFEIPNLDV